MFDDEDFEDAGRHDREPEDTLLNLLAVIHGDGGHHTEAVGLHQSTWDAMKLVPWLSNAKEDAEVLRTMLPSIREIARGSQWSGGKETMALALHVLERLGEPLG